MRITADKIEKKPTHGVTPAEVKYALAVLPSDWIAAIRCCIWLLTLPVLSSCVAHSPQALEERYFVDFDTKRVAYTIPAGFEIGYGGRKERVRVGPPYNQDGRFEMNAFDAGARVGSFYQGVVGDFRDWEMIVEILIYKTTSLESSPTPLERSQAFAKRAFGTEYTRKDGSKVRRYTDFSGRQIGQSEVLVAESTEKERAYEMPTMNGYALIEPRLVYLIPVGSDAFVSVQVVCSTPEKIGPHPLDQAREIGERVVRSIEISRSQ